MLDAKFEGYELVWKTDLSQRSEVISTNMRKYLAMASCLSRYKSVHVKAASTNLFCPAAQAIKNLRKSHAEYQSPLIRQQSREVKAFTHEMHLYSVQCRTTTNIGSEEAKCNKHS